MGFSIRAGILGEWESQFGFTKSELGEITGLGLAGFGVTIILCSLFADRVGYKLLMVAAFLLHASSAVVTLAATPAFGDGGQDGKHAAMLCLKIGMTLFALANGVCESVINPLVATIYPKQKTHYLNILHAGWPGGLILGGVIVYLFSGRTPVASHLRWEITLGLFLVPTLIYGMMVLRDKFPESEARAAGVDFATMLKELAQPMLLFLFFLHALVGYVELGTDSWITDIMNNVISGKAVLLFIYTSAIMFVLRFFAGPIVERINPVGLLFASAVLGACGLYWLGSITTSDAVAAGTAGTAVFLAATIYGVGKTFLWPTMLGVVGERFPRGGALTMGTIGGIGMLSAGLLGGPGIGYKQDYYAAEKLKETSAATFDEYASKDKPNSFLVFPKITGLDGTKVGAIKDKVKEGRAITTEEQLVLDAGLYGGGMALKWTAVVPLTMAVGYLLLVIYFRAKGGYQVEVLHGKKPEGEHYTGGVEGPVE
ncbi:MAG: MFS transporter [Planctomycetota bacterium]|nr:MAG: MFS transporter [Planctomycetota bacterium]